MEANPKGLSCSKHEEQETDRGLVEPAAAADHNLLEPNLVWLHLYALMLGIGVFQTGWVFVGYAGSAHVFAAKFNWSDDETKTWTSIINVSAIIGCTIGCFMGGVAISIGRRKAGLIWQIPAIIGGAICMIENPYCFAAGRFLIGLSGGVYNAVMSKSLDETIPLQVSW